MFQDDMDGYQTAFYFNVERSIRYHERRKTYFERWHLLTSILTVFMAGAFIFQIGKKYEGNIFIDIVSWTVGILAGMDIVVGYAKKAQQHLEFKRRFINLKDQIMNGGNDDETWLKYEAIRGTIESEEPTIYRALDILSYNETVRALGHNKNLIRKLGWFECLTAHFYPWPDIAKNYDNTSETFPAS